MLTCPEEELGLRCAGVNGDDEEEPQQGGHQGRGQKVHQRPQRYHTVHLDRHIDPYANSI